MAHKQVNDNILFFKRLAPMYDWIELILFHIRKKAAQYIDSQQDKTILDVGCGTGSQTLAFAKRAPRAKIVGIDMSPDMLAIAKSKARRKSLASVSFVQGDATALPFDDDSFDVASISLVLHHMSAPDIIRALHEMKRVVKTQGKILIVEYAQAEQTFVVRLGRALMLRVEPAEYRTYLDKGLPYFLDQAGLSIAEKESLLGGNLQMVVCRNPIIDR